MLSKIVKIVRNCQSCQQLSKLIEIVRVVRNCQSCQKFSKLLEIFKVVFIDGLPNSSMYFYCSRFSRSEILSRSMKSYEWEVWWVSWCAALPSWVGSFCRQHQTGDCACALTDFQQSWTDVSQDAAQHQDLGLPGPPSGPHRSQAGEAQRPEVVRRPQLQRWVDLTSSYPYISAESPPFMGLKHACLCNTEVSHYTMMMYLWTVEGVP